MIRRMMVGALALVVVLALAASSAGATQASVAQAIVSQDKIFIASPGYKLLTKFTVKSEAQAKSAIPKLTHTKALLEAAARVVSRAAATTPAQTAGRKDWVAGAHEIATGIGQLADGLEDLVKGHKTQADKVLKASVAIDRRGGKLAARGDKLLGLPTTD